MSQNSLPNNIVWPANALHTALLLLVKLQSHLPPLTEDNITPLPEANPDNKTLQGWLERVSEQVALEFKEAEVAYPDLDKVLRAGAPAILRLPQEGGASDKAGFLLLVDSDNKVSKLLDMTGALITIESVKLRAVLTSHLESHVNVPVNHIAAQISPKASEQEQIIRVLLKEQLASARIGNIWLVRVSPGDNFFRQLRQARIPNKVIWMMGFTIVYQVLSLIAWYQVGQSAIGKSIEEINLHIWALLLLTLIPIQLASVYIRNRLSLTFGMLVRNRLLHGVLKLKPEQIRHQGSSYFFSTLMNLEALEVNSLSLGFNAVLAIIQLAGALFILFSGAGGVSQGIILFCWIIFILILIRIDYQRMGEWTDHQQVMATDLVERMTGHRTRLVQENPQRRHETEDEILSRYSLLSKSMDSISIVLDVVASRRGWLAVSLLGLVHAYFSTQYIGLLLLSLGGIMFAADALDRLKKSLRQFLSALIGWRQVSFVYHSGKHNVARNQKNHFITPSAFTNKAASHPIIKVDKASFSYSPAGYKILDNCSFAIRNGNKILLEGSSGAGKSTVASLLAGMMQPQSGSISLFGISMELLGEKRWHENVVISPQFHENYVLSDTFAFNLLMGRNWPPTEEDMAEAEAVCRELNLGELLEKMPAGMQQTIGESGWRLSHGEKSRLFIARTLLQKSPLIILDESFAALDPGTLQVALPCVMRRSNALLLIAHP